MFVGIILVGVCFTNMGEDTLSTGCPLQKDIQCYIEKCGVSDCSITQCSNYKTLIDKYTVPEDKLRVNTTKDEVEEYIERIMSSYDELVDIKGRKIVKKGDFVTVCFSIYYKRKKISSKKYASLKVGSGKYDKQFETVLLGMKKGKKIYKKVDRTGRLSG